MPHHIMETQWIALNMKLIHSLFFIYGWKDGLPKLLLVAKFLLLFHVKV